jgi:hypothetical protein
MTSFPSLLYGVLASRKNDRTVLVSDLEPLIPEQADPRLPLPGHPPPRPGAARRAKASCWLALSLVLLLSAALLLLLTHSPPPSSTTSTSSDSNFISFHARPKMPFSSVIEHQQPFPEPEPDQLLTSDGRLSDPSQKSLLPAAENAAVFNEVDPVQFCQQLN